MTNTLQLELAIKKNGLTKREIADRLGLSEMGFYKKVNNITEFKASEIAELYKILNLKSLEALQKIFFANYVENKSTNERDTKKC